ncbi:MAG: FGGY-family carbohydrate kinase [Acidimicrobiales bacterium]|jgi:xylulokinase
MTTGLGGPREDRWVLAVDLGTGGPKVGLVSLSGVIACTEHLPVPTDLGTDGQATQDAGLWWDLIRGAARRAVDSGVVRADRIVAVSCTGQWASTVPVDVHGVPVGACQLWSDTRGGPHARRVVGGPVAGYAPLAAVRWIRHSGGAPSTSGADPIGHILHLEHDEPEVARAARWYLEPVDYLSMRFTGTAAATPASMAGAWLTDNRVADPVAYDPVLVAAAGVPAGKLPPLRPTASEIGTVLPEVADDLGLPRGVVVVAGTPDLHSACVGSGSVLPFEPHVAISTTSWVSCPFPKKKTDPVHQMATVPGILPGLRLVANNQESGGGALDWLRGCLDGERVDGAGPTPFDELTTLAGSAPPGSGGLLFTPWLAGERSPIDDRRARAGFHNLSLRTTRAEMVRSVMEGVALNSRWLARAVERFVGRPLGTVRAIGGGATSSLWCSIFASVLDRPVEQMDQPVLANLRGAALIAGLSLGAVSPPELRSLVPVAETHLPEPGAVAVYDRLSAELPAFYKAQKGMFARLAR